MNIYVTADTHFNHNNIIKYCNRPFDNVYQMNETIINNWNNTINQNDIIYHLGDFGFGSKEDLKNIFNRLNGNKYLIMGNHDLKAGRNFYLDLGFIEVYKKKLILDNYIFTHIPINIDNNMINVYGHIHDKPIDPQFDDENHICVSLDKTDFKPLLLLKK